MAKLTPQSIKRQLKTRLSLLVPRKNSLSTGLITLGAIGALFFSFQISGPQRLDATAASQKPVVKAAHTQTAKTLPRSEPTRLRVTRLGIDAPVMPVDLKADGSLDVPAYNQTGWYIKSPTPGQLGPAIIDGHVDSAKYGLAIFWQLRNARPGDVIEVDRADGTTAKFKVDSIKQFPQDNFPTKEVYGNINYAGLRLITCGGVFNSQTHHYSDNIVVFGSLL